MRLLRGPLQTMQLLRLVYRKWASSTANDCCGYTVRVNWCNKHGVEFSNHVHERSARDIGSVGEGNEDYIGI